MKKKYHAEALYMELKERIISLKYAPGESFSVSELEREFGVTRLLVNEILIRLESDTLVSKEGTKYSISRFTINDVIEMSQVREALERKACELIIKKGGLSEEEQKKLYEINDQLSSEIEGNNFPGIMRTDDLFHSCIIECSGNKRLFDFFDRVRVLVSRSRWLTLFNPDFHPTCDEHRAIIAGLVSKDLDAAVAATENHIRLAQESFCRVYYDTDNDYSKSYHILKTMRDAL